MIPFVPVGRGPHAWPRSAIGLNVTPHQTLCQALPPSGEVGRWKPQSAWLLSAGIPGPPASLTWKTTEMRAEKGPGYKTRCRLGPEHGPDAPPTCTLAPTPPAGKDFQLPGLLLLRLPSLPRLLFPDLCNALSSPSRLNPQPPGPSQPAPSTPSSAESLKFQLP